MSLEPVSVAEVMSECQAMMEPQAQQRGVSMTFPRFDNPSFVNADRTRLKQIVINLISNAIKYNKEQGTVVVECITNNPERTRISVSDTGAGLSPEKLAQLFQPFNRLGQEAAGVAGTGIGLVVTKRLAELMEGALGVDSIAGKGSVFWCDLPSSTAPRVVVEHPEAAAPDEAQASTAARMRTVLYVEDNPANMKLVEQLIARRPDIRLLTAVNGTLGIEAARTSQPTVILMDINLPGMSGVEALKTPARGSSDGAHSGRCPQRQRNAARYPVEPGSGILPLSDQAHKGEGVHGHSERGARIGGRDISPGQVRHGSCHGQRIRHSQRQRPAGR